MLAVDELIEPNLAVANDPIMREPQREYMPRQPSLPTPRPRSRETLDGNTTTAHSQPNATTPRATSRARAPLTRPHSFIHADPRLAVSGYGIPCAPWSLTQIARLLD